MITSSVYYIVMFQAEWFTYAVTFKLREVLWHRKLLLFSFYRRNQTLSELTYSKVTLEFSQHVSRSLELLTWTPRVAASGKRLCFAWLSWIQPESHWSLAFNSCVSTLPCGWFVYTLIKNICRGLGLRLNLSCLLQQLIIQNLLPSS